MAEVSYTSDLITVYGKTDGRNATGVFTLYSTSFTNSPNYLRFDKGVRVKIWGRRVEGAPATIYIEFAPDATAPSPSWTPVGAVVLSSACAVELEKRRPVVIECRTGREGIRFAWEQSTAGVTHVELDIEVEPAE